MLIERQRQVTRCLTEKLLSYSSGRTLEPTDHGQVDEIVSVREEATIELLVNFNDTKLTDGIKRFIL